MKTLDDIRSDFIDRRQQKDSELLAELREVLVEKNALLQRAGIHDGPGDWFTDDGKWDAVYYRNNEDEAYYRNDETYYHDNVRERVFNDVSDLVLRCQIMAKINYCRFKKYNRWERLGSFEEQYADRLRGERCRLPRARPILQGFILSFVLIGVSAYFSSGVLEKVVDIGFLIAAVVACSVVYLVRLFQHDVTMQEAIKLVERSAALSKREAERRFHSHEIFSLREIRTGEAEL